MAYTQYTAATNIIGSLGTTPEDRPGMTDQQLKDKFDENSVNIVEYINEVLLPEAEVVKIVPVTASKILSLTDAYTMQSCAHASVQIDITIPPHSSVAFPVGTQIVIARDGAAEVAVVAGSGVTIQQTKLKVSTQYDTAVLVQTQTLDTWKFVGSTKA